MDLMEVVAEKKVPMCGNSRKKKRGRIEGLLQFLTRSLNILLVPIAFGLFFS